jgi:dUTPase
MILPGATTNIPLNWKLRLPPSHFGLLMALNQQAKKGIVLGGVTDADYHGEIGLPLHNGGKQDYVLECRRSLKMSLSTTMSCD